MTQKEVGMEWTVRQLETVYACPGVKVTHTKLDPGQEIPWHKHSEVGDTFYAIRGPITIEIAGADSNTVLSAGECAQVGRATAHRVSNRGSEMVEFLLIQGIGKYDLQLADDTVAFRTS